MKAGNLLVRNFVIFSALLLLCVLSLGLYSFQANKDIENADSWVEHTQAIINETQGILTGTNQILVAHRGYLLYGLEEYVTRYEAAKEELFRQIAQVKFLASDNARQLARIREIEKNAQAFTQVMEKAFTDPSPGQVRGDEDTAAILVLRDQIIEASQTMLSEEYTLLRVRADALGDKTDDYRITLFIGGAGSAFLLLLLNLFLLKAQSRRTEAEKSLKETENRLALAIRGSNSGVFDWDFETNHLYWSPQYKMILGYADHELPSESKVFEELLHPDDKDRVLETYNQYIAENLSEYADIFRMKHKSGRWVWIQARGMGLFDDNGKATRFVGTHTDISHLKDYERRLEEEKDRAQKANAAKSEFLAHMSHEIRTPLTAISGIAEILMNLQDGLDDKQKKLIHTLFSSAVSLKDLISDILDFSKIESGEIELNEKLFPLGNMFEQVISITAIKAAEKQLDYTVEYNDLEEETFYGDQARLRQILINLIGNAIKFTDKGYVRVTMEKTIMDKIPVLMIRVEDSGIGINEQSLDVIFEKFRQADASVSRKYGGTGLGLPISRKLAELMGGHIHVDSQPEKGSVFTLYLPCKKGGGAKGSDKGSSKGVVPASNKEKDRLQTYLREAKKILLVEDYEGNIVVLSHLLEEMGYEFDVARTGLEALDHWRTNHYDLMLMDIQMPEMDGLTATRTIRGLEEEGGFSPTPIIGLTAHALVADQEKCIESGMDAYMAKPIDEAELKRTIKRYLDKGQPGLKKSRVA